MITFESITITRDKVDFEVSGDFEHYQEPRGFEPSEGGWFCNDIFVEVAGFEMSEYLDQRVLESIIEEAEERLSHEL